MERRDREGILASKEILHAVSENSDSMSKSTILLWIYLPVAISNTGFGEKKGSQTLGMQLQIFHSVFHGF